MGKIRLIAALYYIHPLRPIIEVVHIAMWRLLAGSKELSLLLPRRNLWDRINLGCCVRSKLTLPKDEEGDTINSLSRRELSLSYVLMLRCPARSRITLPKDEESDGINSLSQGELSPSYFLTLRCRVRSRTTLPRNNEGDTIDPLSQKGYRWIAFPPWPCEMFQRRPVNLVVETLNVETRSLPAAKTAPPRLAETRRKFHQNSRAGVDPQRLVII